MTKIARATPIYVVSGGAGASGELLLQTLLAQFPQANAKVENFSQVHTSEQAQEVVAAAVREGALVVHTMVDRELHGVLVDELTTHAVQHVDLAGALLDQLSARFGAQPLGQPGRYREHRNGYFRRIAAIEYAVTHDDGQRLEEFADADIVLVGVSRTGKTPLSIYLSLQGWKTANYPIVPNVPFPSEINQVDPGRVVGLTIAPAQLVRLRKSRQARLGLGSGSYVDLAHVIEEVRAANHLFLARGYHTIDVTDKPIETISEEVISAVTQAVSTATRL